MLGIMSDIMARWTQVISFWTENEETETMAALKRFNIARLNKITSLFALVIKCMEGDYISSFDIFPLFRKFMAI
jgi:hypothetical protein